MTRADLAFISWKETAVTAGLRMNMKIFSLVRNLFIVGKYLKQNPNVITIIGELILPWSM